MCCGKGWRTCVYFACGNYGVKTCSNAFVSHTPALSKWMNDSSECNSPLESLSVCFSVCIVFCCATISRNTTMRTSKNGQKYEEGSQPFTLNLWQPMAREFGWQFSLLPNTIWCWWWCLGNKITKTIQYNTLTHKSKWQNAFHDFVAAVLFAHLYHYIIHGQIDNEPTSTPNNSKWKTNTKE